MNTINHLVLSWSVSRGKDTYGYNICRLDDRNSTQRYKCIGGGYDMIGTVFGNWLSDNYQEKLLTLKERANYFRSVSEGFQTSNREDSLYGMTYWEKDNRIGLDGACGLNCMIKIAEEIGLDIERDCILKGRRRGETVGWYVTETK